MTAKTTAERQRDYRARKAAQALSELRGVFAPAEHHAALREAAAKELRRLLRRKIDRQP